MKSTGAQRDALQRADNAAAERARLEGERQAGRPDLAAIARADADHAAATHDLQRLIGQKPDRDGQK